MEEVEEEEEEEEEEDDAAAAAAAADVDVDEVLILTRCWNDILTWIYWIETKARKVIQVYTLLVYLMYNSVKTNKQINESMDEDEDEDEDDWLNHCTVISKQDAE